MIQAAVSGKKDGRRREVSSYASLAWSPTGPSALVCVTHLSFARSHALARERAPCEQAVMGISRVARK